MALVSEDVENHDNGPAISVEAEKQKMEEYEATMKSYRLKSSCLFRLLTLRGAIGERWIKEEAKSTKTGKNHSGKHSEVDHWDSAWLEEQVLSLLFTSQALGLVHSRR